MMISSYANAWSVSCNTNSAEEKRFALPSAPFAAEPVSYYEDKSDGNFAWDVKYDLSFNGSAFTVKTKLHLSGDPAGAYAQIWEQGIENIWNDQYCLAASGRIYPIRFDVQYADAAQAHYDINVSNTVGRDDMLNWYTQTDWGPSYQDELVAHEYGHMLGVFDEYAGGATRDGFTTTGTLMSDLTVTLRPDYMSTIDYFAELFSGQTFEVVEASSQPTVPLSNDTLRGTGNADILRGLGGDDLLYGLGGNDQLYGNEGTDLLFGGDGSDLLFGGTGNDRLRGNNGNDTLAGGDGADRFILTRYGNDDRITDFSFASGDRLEVVGGLAARVFNSGGSAMVDFGNGDRVLLAGISVGAVKNDWFVDVAASTPPTNDTLNGAAGNDCLLGLAGNDILSGRGGVDRLYGGAGTDTLFGNGGNDVLFGDAGNDRLRGNDGNDTMTGGDGADRFTFARYSNKDRITDFSFGQGDRLELAGGLTYKVSDSNGSALVDFGNGDQVLLAGISAASVTKDWFVMA